jgi:hypothetical protein
MGVAEYLLLHMYLMERRIRHLPRRVRRPSAPGAATPAGSGRSATSNAGAQPGATPPSPPPTLVPSGSVSAPPTAQPSGSGTSPPPAVPAVPAPSSSKP